jgi:hypothetical protein
MTYYTTLKIAFFNTFCETLVKTLQFSIVLEDIFIGIKHVDLSTSHFC